MADVNEDEKREGFDFVNAITGILLAGLSVFLVLLVISLFIPNYVRGPRHSPQMACINNLRQIDGAKQTWGMETHALSNAIPTCANIQPFLGREPFGSIPCPSGGTYVIGSLQVAPTCSTKDHKLE